MIAEDGIDALNAWLAEAGLRGEPEPALVSGFCERAVAAGLPISRALVLIDSLHPVDPQQTSARFESARFRVFPGLGSGSFPMAYQRQHAAKIASATLREARPIEDCGLGSMHYAEGVA